MEIKRRKEKACTKWHFGRSAVFSRTCSRLVRLSVCFIVWLANACSGALSFTSCCVIELSYRHSHSYCIPLLLQYVNRATSSVRLAMKEPGRMKAMQQEVFAYNAEVWEGGEPQEKVAHEQLAVPTGLDGGV